MAAREGVAAKKAALRRGILEAAARLFSAHGYGGTTLQHVADELAISRPALYYYFRSKEDILACLVEDITVAAEEQSRAALLDTQADPQAALRQAALRHAGQLLRHPLEFRVLDSAERHLPDDVRQVHDRAKRALLDNFTAIIARGIASGDFRPVDAQIAAFGIIGMCAWTAWWFSPDGRLPASQVAQTIADMAVAAVRREDAGREGGSGRALGPADLTRRLRDDLSLLAKLIDGHEE